MTMTSSRRYGQRRLPAEWEEHDCVLLAWPHEETDWAYMLDDARKAIGEIVRAISRHECVLLVGPESLCLNSVNEWNFDPRRVRFIDIPTNDTWARDFGPISISDNGKFKILDFKFNGWGLKFAADKDNIITSRLSEEEIFACERENRLNFVLEGGSIESDGDGTMLTTAECLLSSNRNGEWDEEKIKEYLADVFGVEHIIFLRSGSLIGDDTDSHVDTLARLAPCDTIVYCGPGQPDNPNYISLSNMRDELHRIRTRSGGQFNLVELPLPDVIEIDGEILPATYANYLVTPHTILMPSYRQPNNDFIASQVIKIAYPDREVVQIDCVPLIRQHGSLHCVTMQFPIGTVADIKDGYWSLI